MTLWEPLQQPWEMELLNPFLQMRKPRPRKPLSPDSKCVSWIQNRINYSLTMHRINVLCHLFGQYFKNSYTVFDLYHS